MNWRGLDAVYIVKDYDICESLSEKRKFQEGSAIQSEWGCEVVLLKRKKGERGASKGHRKKVEYNEVKKWTEGEPYSKKIGARTLDCVYPDWKKNDSGPTARNKHQGLPLLQFLIEEASGDTDILALPGGFISHIGPGDRIEESVERISKNVPMLICGLDRLGTEIATPYAFVEGRQEMRIRQCSTSCTEKPKPEYLKDSRTLEHDGLLFGILSCGEIFSKDLRELVKRESPDVVVDLAHFSCSRLRHWIRRLGEIAPDGCGFLTQHLANPFTHTEYHTGKTRHIGTVNYVLSQDDGVFGFQKVSVRRFLV